MSLFSPINIKTAPKRGFLLWLCHTKQLIIEGFCVAFFQKATADPTPRGGGRPPQRSKYFGSLKAPRRVNLQSKALQRGEHTSGGSPIKHNYQSFIMTEPLLLNISFPFKAKEDYCDRNDGDEQIVILHKTVVLLQYQRRFFGSHLGFGPLR